MTTSIKNFAYSVFDKINLIAYNRIKSPIIKKFWGWFAQKHIAQLINETPDYELRKDLFDVYQILRPYFEQTNLAVEIAEAIKLGSPRPLNLGEIKKALELEIDELL